jgi:hypothetical protein
VTRRQIHDVNVISDTRPVGRVVVITPHIQPISTSDCDLRNKGDKVVGDACGIFADQATLMGASRIEIAENSYPPLRIARKLITKHIFNC